MFTGIIETIGNVLSVEKQGSNLVFKIESPITGELKVDQSLAHDGVCLTVTGFEGNAYFVTAIDETLQKTTAGQWMPGKKINLERCMPAHGRFDGHIVQGHTDQTGVCTEIEDFGGSWKFHFEYDPGTDNITVKKGSICVNGASLTVVDSYDGRFTVAIIPYTFEHTNFHQIQIGGKVNLEFDILGKYIKKMMRDRA